MRHPSYRCMRCINCGVATQRLRRHFTSSLPGFLLNILARWLTIEVPMDTNICHPCFKLLSSEIACEGDVRLFGFTLVCITCGRSVRSVQHHAVERNNSIFHNLPRSHPAHHQDINYACHPCWMRHQRYQRQSNQDRIQEDSPQSENEIKVFCPKCDTEVSHTAEGIQEDQTKILIAKVYHYFEREYEELKKFYGDLDLTPLSKFGQRTALATGVSETTVLQILKEEERRNADKRQEPPEKRRRARKRSRQTDSSSEEDSSDDNDDDNEQSSNVHDEEPEIYVPAAVKVEPSDVEMDKEQAVTDRISVDVKTEPRSDVVESTNETLALNEPAGTKRKGRKIPRLSDVTSTRVNEQKKERQQRYREQNREKLKQREAERRQRLQNSEESSTFSNIEFTEIINEPTIDEISTNSQCVAGLKGTQTSPIQRNEQTKENNALQKRRERQQRYRGQNRDKLKQRERERRQRLQNSEMVTESSTSSNIEFTEIINEPIIDEISTNCQSSSGFGGTQTTLFQRNEQTKAKNALQKKRGIQQRYWGQIREKLQQRDTERRQRLQNSEMITESSASSNIEFQEIINEPIIDKISTNCQSSSGLEGTQITLIQRNEQTKEKKALQKKKKTSTEISGTDPRKTEAA